MKYFLEIGKEACLISGGIQIKNLKSARQIHFKGEINLVTETDHQSEKEIVSLIQGRCPSHDILAEEGSGIRRDSEFKWIIDPLDGTTNFAHGYPLFCTSIALEYRGEIVLGAVYEPHLKELFIAEKGAGATLNGEKLKVSETSDLKKALLSTGFAYNVRETKENNLNHFQNFIMRSQAVRRAGVAAVDLCYTAVGRFDGFWELNLFPWDVAAGYLIVEEAGGNVTDFSGKAFSVYSKEILATNGRPTASLAKHLNKGCTW